MKRYTPVWAAGFGLMPIQMIFIHNRDKLKKYSRVLSPRTHQRLWWPKRLLFRDRLDALNCAEKG